MTPQLGKEYAMKWIHSFLRDEEGQDIIEYALLAFFISIFAIIAIKAIGPLVNSIYVAVEAALT
jgi:Flp pilus assembly pilin Flp